MKRNLSLVWLTIFLLLRKACGQTACVNMWNADLSNPNVKICDGNF